MSHLERVNEFLDPIHPRDSRDFVVAAGEALARAATKTPAIAKVMKALHSQIPSPLVKGGQLALYNRMRGIGTNLNLPDVHESVKPLLAVLYLKAKKALQGSKGKITLADIPKLVGNVRQRPKILEQDFLGELLIETELRAARDPDFARQLENAAAEIRAAIPDFEQQMQRTGSSIAISCEICREDPETGELICGEASKWVCWIIIIIVIIIIIL